MSSCAGCVQEATEKNRAMDDLLIKAKQQAIEDQKPKAICEDQIEGLFITDAFVARSEHFNIKHIVSYL